MMQSAAIVRILTSFFLVTRTDVVIRVGALKRPFGLLGRRDPML